MAERMLALVLSGGGARGALQAGALRALHEAGYRPDLIAGTSVGAMNAAVLGLHGLTAVGVAALEAAWREAAAAELVPPNYVWLAAHALLGTRGAHNIRTFMIAQGVAPELTFGELRGAQVRIVSTDLRAGQALIHGANPADNVLDAVLASAAIPVWVQPLRLNERVLMDGGAISNLPIEAALDASATEIVALELGNAGNPPSLTGIAEWGYLVLRMAHQRQAALELALAQARGVPVRLIRLPCPDGPTSEQKLLERSAELMAAGYALAREQIAGWEE
jgi:NTE family protein